MPKPRSHPRLPKFLAVRLQSQSASNSARVWAWSQAHPWGSPARAVLDLVTRFEQAPPYGGLTHATPRDFGSARPGAQVHAVAPTSRSRPTRPSPCHRVARARAREPDGTAPGPQGQSCLHGSRPGIQHHGILPHVREHQRDGGPLDPKRAVIPPRLRAQTPPPSPRVEGVVARASPMFQGTARPTTPRAAAHPSTRSTTPRSRPS